MKNVKKFIAATALVVGLATAGLAVAEPVVRSFVVDGVRYIMICDAGECRIISQTRVIQ